MKQALVRQPIFRSAIFALPALMLAMLVSGCSGSSFYGQKSPPQVTISASVTSIALGGSSMLTVKASFASSNITINGTDGSVYTITSTTGGTQDVSPTTTTTYTATATGPGGTTVSSGVKVTVIPPNFPTVNIVATPPTITFGDKSTIKVTVTNATKVQVLGTDGSVTNVDAAGGSFTVSPVSTTTYTATATGAAGTTPATAQTTLTVTPALPTVSITPPISNILLGNSATLTVVATNASGGVTVTAPDGTVVPGGNLPNTGGTVTVTPPATGSFVYTATATGALGTTPAQQTATVNVTTQGPKPTLTFTANSASSTSVKAGTPVTLSVTTANATKVTITDNQDSNSYTLTFPLSATAATQTQVVTPMTVNTYTYTATAVGPGGTTTKTVTVTATVNAAPTLLTTLSQDDTSWSVETATINVGGSVTLYAKATNLGPGGLTVAGSDGSNPTLTQVAGSTTLWTAVLAPTQVTSGTPIDYTVTANPLAGQTAAVNHVYVNVGNVQGIQNIQHVIFDMQENHTFDNYFGMLNPYRKGAKDTHPDGTTQAWNIGDDGNTYNVDGIDDKLTGANKITNLTDAGKSVGLFKLTTACIDDDSSDWLASFGDVNRYNVQVTRTINMDGFVHNAEGYATSCFNNKSCSGKFEDDPAGQRAMGYYDQTFLNYYYFMASQFAVSDRWFSPIASKSVDNRIATFSGGTTQGLVKDPSGDDHLSGQSAAPTIFSQLNKAGISWKIYYTATVGFCKVDTDGEGFCGKGGGADYPATYFSNFQDSYNYLQVKTGACPSKPVQTVPSSQVGDRSNYFCIDPNHIAPLYQYYADLQNGNLPQFAFIEAGYGADDEHPGSDQPVVWGQVEMSKNINALMNTATATNPANNYWSNSVFFFSYDEGGGPYDHVPPVPGHSNDKTLGDKSIYPDIGGIAVNPDSYNPCALIAGSWHCDLTGTEAGMNTGDVVQQQGFAAQHGFRLPNFVISPFARRHYVSHIPMDHTAVIRFVEDLFIKPNVSNFQYMTNLDAAQPDLTDFFDFYNIPWQVPPTPPSKLFTGDSKNNCYPTQAQP